MAQGHKESVSEMCAKIDAVTREVRRMVFAFSLEFNFLADNYIFPIL